MNEQNLNFASAYAVKQHKFGFVAVEFSRHRPVLPTFWHKICTLTAVGALEISFRGFSLRQKDRIENTYPQNNKHIQSKSNQAASSNRKNKKTFKRIKMASQKIEEVSQLFLFKN